MKPDYQRQLDFYSPNNGHRVVVIGSGSLGSYITFGLVRMGVKDITIVDHDTIENINLPNQFFTERNLPTEEHLLYKVDAIKATLDLLLPDTMAKVNFKLHRKRIEDAHNEIFGDNIYTAVFFAVDDMNVRKWIWNELTYNDFPCNCIIDPRTGGLYANIFSIKTNDRFSREIYKQNLWSNEESVPLPCTGTSIVDVSLAVAGECVGRFRQFTKNNLQVIWTFHDYSLGCSSIMAHRPLDGKIVDNELVTNIGTQSTSTGEQNG